MTIDTIEAPTMDEYIDWYNDDFLRSERNGEVTPMVMDTGVGYLGRSLQGLVDAMAGAIEQDLGPEWGRKARSDCYLEEDFRRSTLGKQVRRYMDWAEGTERDGYSLSQIVRDRNYFAHEFPARCPYDGHVRPEDVARLKKAILAVRRATNRISAGLAEHPVRESAARAGDGAAEPVVDAEELKDFIAGLVGGGWAITDRVTVSDINCEIQREYGVSPRKVLGQGLLDYLRGAYDVYGDGNDAWVTRRSEVVFSWLP